MSTQADPSRPEEAASNEPRRRSRARRVLKWSLSTVGVVVVALAFVVLANPFNIRNEFLADRIVKLRVAPERLENPKDPSDYGMNFDNVDIVTADNVRLSAWEIPATTTSNRTVIVNHPLLTTRYGSEKGLDGVEAEFLPMVKHLHDAGYNVVMYDFRGQGDSDGGIGSAAIGTETPVGVGVLEWQDVAASLRYVLAHPEYGDDEIVFLSQCMGANATFLAWQEEPELFANPQIKGLIANQPTLSYEFSDRYIREKVYGLDLVDDVLEAQIEKYGFGFADPLAYLPSLTVPVLYAQVENDIYTFNKDTGQNDIVEIMDATPTDHDIVWIGSDQETPFGSDRRFDAYQYFNVYPEALLNFLAEHTS